MTDKKAPPAKTGKKVDKQVPKAFFNWAIEKNSGGLYAGSKGFALFQSPKFPNKQEDYLIDLAARHGGTVTLTMRVTINTYNPVEAPSIDDITVL